MKSIFEFWSEIAQKIREKNSVFLALDYDGVLAPIAPQPVQALLPPATRELLKELVKSPRIRVAVISGRAVDDVRNHLGVPQIIYAGNHGIEIDLNGVQEPHVGEDNRSSLIEMRSELQTLFAEFPGVLLEDKGFGICVHYREVNPTDLPGFKERFSHWAKNLPPSLKIADAKMVYEVRPKSAWNKGDAVWHIWQATGPSALPICLGDDLTDEDGFRTLLGRGINIYVGEERHSYAEYIIRAQTEVGDFLRLLTNELKAAPGEKTGHPKPLSSASIVV